MSKFVEKTSSKGMNFLMDVVFVYVKIQKPQKKYESEDTQWSVDAVVDKTTAKAYKKIFPKNSYTVVENEDFNKKYKIDPPFKDQDEQYVLSIRQTTTWMDNGVEKPIEDDSGIRPKVLELVGGKNVDVTLTKLVGNGSKGNVSFKSVTTERGTFSYLRAIQVTDLIEYEEQDATGFGEVESDEPAEDSGTGFDGDSPTDSGDDFGDDFE